MHGKWFFAVNERKDDSIILGGVFVGRSPKTFFAARSVHSFHDKIDNIIRENFGRGSKILEINVEPPIPKAALLNLPRLERLTQFRWNMKYIPRTVYCVQVFVEAGGSDWDDACGASVNGRQGEEELI